MLGLGPAAKQGDNITGYNQRKTSKNVRMSKDQLVSP